MGRGGGTTVQVRVLGRIEVGDDRFRVLGGPTQRRLFGVLVARRGGQVSLAELTEILWPDRAPPERAEHNVRTYVHRLRTSMGDDADRLETTSVGYSLRLDADTVDADRFEHLARLASRAMDTGDLPTALDHADAALALWHGRPYGEFGDEPWAMAESVHLTELYWSIRERRAEVLIAAGRARDAVGDLERLIVEQPLRERPRALLMRALYDSGRQPEALRAYRDFRRLLIDDLGVEPTDELIELDRQIASSSVAPVDAGRAVAGAYELRERIGEGAFAVVHRAHQASLGRDVAIKIVRAELADEPVFIRRFEAEARMVASIEHPNVVPLYDFWREPGQALLVMRWMTGGSLEQRLDGTPWRVDETIELVEQIAAALDAAHARNVLHRDVKPGNILFDDAGRALLGDFGIALTADEWAEPGAALAEGSPQFASPEQLRREPAGPESDVHALAVVARVLLTGRTDDTSDDTSVVAATASPERVGPGSAAGSGLARAIDDVLAVATAERPADRYPTAGAFARALRAAAAGDVEHPTTAEATIRTNPYRGLRPFTEADASEFYGRARITDELVAHLATADHRLALLVGPSGSGKSSLVRAGLLPAIRSGRIDGSDRWFTTTMVPGREPFEALETALLRVAVNPPAALLDQLRDGDRGVLRAVRRVLPSDDSVIAIFIDQFEELYTSAVGPGDRDAFLRALAAAVDEPHSPVRLVATLRADFFDHPLRHPEFAPLVNRHTMAITPLAPDELHEAITRPAASVGVAFDAGVVSEIVTDVSHQPGALPLLQYALTQTFDAVDGNTVTAAAYHRVGGLAGALAEQAEALYLEADADEQRAIRGLLGRLVALGEGTDDTRRRIRRAELPGDPATDRVVDRFGAARLLTFDHDPTDREPTIEIAHEALLREWPRLRDWLDEDRDALRVHRHLTGSAASWSANDRDPSDLYRGARLEAVESMLDDPSIALNSEELAFICDSRRERDAARDAERARVRRLRRLVATAAVIAALAILAGAVAIVQWNRANDEAFDAETARLVATARELAATKPRESMLLALAAHQRERTPATLGALQASLSQAGPVLGHLGIGIDYVDVAWTTDDAVAAIREDGIDLYDRFSGDLVDAVDLDVGRGPLPRFSEGERAAGGGGLLAVAAGTEVHVFGTEGSLSKVWDASMGDPVAAVEVAGDGTVVASDVAGTVAGWDASGRPLFSTPHELPENLAEQYDEHADLPLQGRELFEREQAWVVPRVVGEEVHLMIGGLNTAIDLAGERTRAPVYPIVDLGGVAVPASAAVVGERDEQLIHAGFWSIGLLARDAGTTPSVPLADRTFGGGNPTMVDTVPVWGEPVTVLDNGVVVWFDLADGSRTRQIDLEVGSVRSASPGPAPDTVAVATADGVVLVTLGGGGPIAVAQPRHPDQGLLGITTDGRYLSMGGLGWLAPVGLFERGSDGDYRPASTASYEGSIYAAAPPEPGDPWLVSFTDADGTGRSHIHRLDGDDGPVLVVEQIEPSGGVAGDIDPAWRYDAIGTRTAIEVFDLVSRDLRQSLELPPGALEDGGPSGVRFDHTGGRLLVSSPTGASLLYDTATWTRIEGLVEPHDIAIGYWSTDGRLIATSSSDGRIAIRDGETFETVREMVGAVGTRNSWADGALLFSTDNSLLITNHDNVGRLWDVASGQQIGTDIPTHETTRSGVNTGENVQLVTGTEHSALVWNLDPDTWPELACRTAGTNLTRAEWTQWGPRDEEYRAICERRPAET